MKVGNIIAFCLLMILLIGAGVRIVIEVVRRRNAGVTA